MTARQRRLAFTPQAVSARDWMPAAVCLALAAMILQ